MSGEEPTPNHNARSNLISVLALCVAICSAIFSWRSNCISESALEFSKEEATREKQPRIGVAIEWARNDLYIGRIQKTDQPTAADTDTLYFGFDAFATIKLTNTSDFPVTIDRVRWSYPWKGSLVFTSQSDNFVDRSSGTPAELPKFLERGGSYWVIVRVPIPLSGRIASQLDDLTPGRTYSGEDIVAALSRDTGLSNEFSPLWDFMLRPQVQTPGTVAQRNAQLPDLLLTMSGNGTVIGGERSIEVLVKLASGEQMDTVIDYVHIGGNALGM